MTEFKGFTFSTPSNQQVSDLTKQFSRISAEEDDNRLNSFKAYKSPLTSRSVDQSQEKRRLQALEIQKKQRSMTVSKARQLALDLATASDDSEEEAEQEHAVNITKRSRDEEGDEEMQDISQIKLSKKNPKQYTKKDNKKNIHADQIMYAETMESIPPDIYDNWIMMICPKGKRCLVSSGNGHTIARARNGKIISKFKSTLPNGSGSRSNDNFCILDCVYDAVHWTYYVLDVMCWKGYSVFDCDTSFRHFWLQTKLNEEMEQVNHFYRFKPLMPLSVTREVIFQPEACLKQQDMEYDIDGLLFYHKETNYRGGSTPLVCWVPRDDINKVLQPLTGA